LRLAGALQESVAPPAWHGSPDRNPSLTIRASTSGRRGIACHNPGVAIFYRRLIRRRRSKPVRAMRDVAVVTGPTWGEVQSLAQLSVALNGAFSAIAGFVGSDFARERAELARLIETMDAQAARGVRHTSRIRGLSPRVVARSLIAECDAIERRTEFLLTTLVRPLCVVGAVVGMILLIVSSYLYARPVGPFLICCLIGSNAPFFLGLLIVSGISAWLNRRVKRSRLNISAIVHGTAATGVED